MTDRQGSTNDGGAAAVEFALILPILVLLLFGILWFGLILNTQISLSGAAREGARVMAITNDWAQAEAATIAAAPSVEPAPSASRSPASCAPGTDITVAATTPVSYTIPLFGEVNLNLRGEGVMRCGG